MKNNFLYVISGLLKKKKIKVNPNKVQPTPSKIRKTLFEWLTPFIKHKKCLDCFAGSGILSLEALSRKASHVTLIEKNYKNFKTIQNNLKKIKNNYYTIYNMDIFLWLKKQANKFDIIFIDPPYKNNFINELLYYIEKKKITKKDTLIYLETNIHQHLLNIPNLWCLYKKKNIKHHNYLLFIKK